jgi:hypothetical protein
LVFCLVDRDARSIQGRLYFPPDTTLLKAEWSFETGDPSENAGGEVVFARTPDPTGEEHLVSAQGIFWRKELRGPRYEGLLSALHDAGSAAQVTVRDQAI